MRRFRTEKRSPLSWLALAGFAACALVGCDVVDFDFGTDGGGVCDQVSPIPLACEDDLDSGCTGGGDVTTKEISGSAGCTPAGMALGVAALDFPESGSHDLFAWTEPVPWIDSVFHDGVSLAVFPDPCGEETFGADLECDYRPWLLENALPAADLYLHVQTAASGDVLDRTATVGFQIMPSGAWDDLLPPTSQPMECDTTPNGPLDDALLYPDPLTGEPRQLDFTAKAPASLSGLTGAPRICGSSAAGWRQAGYLLQNLGDPPPIHVSGIHVRKTGAEQGSSVSFHYGLFSCVAGSDVVSPEQIALASSCDDSGDHPTKRMDLDIAVWDPDDTSTNYVLILQIPPGEGTSFFLQFDVD